MPVIPIPSDPVSMIATTDIVPGDRIGFEAPTAASQQRREGLGESVLRLGRGATVMPDRDHKSATTDGGLPDAQVSGSRLGPQCDYRAKPGANPTDRQSPGEPASPSSDTCQLITAVWSDQSAKPFAIVDCAALLTPDRALTHSSDQCRAQARSGQLPYAATFTNSILTAPSASRRNRMPERGAA